jgi:hypothetical protein
MPCHDADAYGPLGKITVVLGTTVPCMWIGEQCWRPCGHYASFVIDDPLLRLKRPHRCPWSYCSTLLLCKDWEYG